MQPAAPSHHHRIPNRPSLAAGEPPYASYERQLARLLQNRAPGLLFGRWPHLYLTGPGGRIGGGGRTGRGDFIGRGASIGAGCDRGRGSRTGPSGGGGLSGRINATAVSLARCGGIARREVDQINSLILSHF